MRHTWPCGQVTPSHAAVHLPALQTFPASQVLPAHDASMHRPFSQTSPEAQAKYHVPHLGRQTPRSQTCVPGQVAPLSTVPSQSLSRPSQASVPAVTDCLHFKVVPVTHSLRPAAHTPFMPVSHGVPPPSQVRPEMK